MSFLGERNAIALGVSQHTVIGNSLISAQSSPSLLLQFAGAETLDPRITFTRSTTATYYNSAGVLSTAAINAPRLDYNPATLAPLGLLIEQSRTNLCNYSELFNNAAWNILTRVAVVANTTAAPNGATTAFSLNETATTGSHYLGRTGLTATANTYVTLSIFVKAKERSFAGLQLTPDGTNYIYCTFNLATGVASTPVNAGNGSNCSAQMTAVGNGWYRCSISGIPSSTAANPIAAIYVGTSNVNFVNTSYTGVAGSGVYIWGAQLEAGSFITSYIPTVASQVTRAADIAVMTGTNFSSWYNASQGTFAATYEASPNTFTSYLVASNGVTAQNSCRFDNDGGNMRVVYYSGSSAVATLSLGAVGAAGTVNKVASAYQVNDFAASRNAKTVVTDTAGAVPVSLTQLNIGADPSGASTNVMNTHIRQITYYPRRLSNAELQGITR